MYKYDSLTPEITRILKYKGTEVPFSGKSCDDRQDGSYLCRGCGAVLFRANQQFHSGCGWPSFDDEINGAIKREIDADGRRTEILCANCDGHLGHVFIGEGMTAKNKRHCVNALAIEWVSDSQVMQTDEAIVAGGCFWGVQHLLEQLPGVLKTEVGYTNGTVDHPTYEQVCRHQTGHVEAVRVVFDAEKLSYEDLIKYFFEIHDPTQHDGQGPDVGSQYLSELFYFNEAQMQTAQKLIHLLKDAGLKVGTQIKPVAVFWPAEEYHQHYYQKNNQAPYCHHKVNRFKKG